MIALIKNNLILAGAIVLLLIVNIIEDAVIFAPNTKMNHKAEKNSTDYNKEIVYN